MKRIITTMVAIAVTLSLTAQTRREALLQYQAARQKALTDYASNYRKACEEFMRKRWEAFNVEEPTQLPERKEPTAPIVKPEAVPTAPQPATPNNEGVAASQTPKTEVAIPKPKNLTGDIPAQGETVAIQPQKPIVTTNPKVDTSRPLKFMFYNTECSVSFDSSCSINLASLAENDVASAWQSVASGRFDRIFQECQILRKTLNLNDWGYYRLVQTVGDACFGVSSDKSQLLQSFLLSEAGFKMRLARGDGRLRLLVGVEQKVYLRPYFRIGGSLFYLLDGKNKASRFEVCNFAIPGERPLSLRIKELPNLAYSAGTPVKRVDVRQNIEITTDVNANLVSFMKDYPPCDWTVYALAQLSEPTSKLVMPTMQQLIQGKSEQAAAQSILSFIHNAFPYKADAQQFGAERTLFAEEVFAYKYSDCEDRSILFAQLVNKLLSLDVVLLHYPEHIATAVRFSGDVAGDKVKVGNVDYVVCDPTYVGADVGEPMPEFRNVVAKIVKID